MSESKTSNRELAQIQHLNKLLKETRQTMKDTQQKVARLWDELVAEEFVIWGAKKKMLTILNKMTELGIAADE